MKEDDPSTQAIILHPSFAQYKNLKIGKGRHKRQRNFCLVLDPYLLNQCVIKDNTLVLKETIHIGLHDVENIEP